MTKAYFKTILYRHKTWFTLKTCCYCLWQLSICDILVNETRRNLWLYNQYYLWMLGIHALSSILSESKYRWKPLIRLFTFLKLLWGCLWDFLFIYLFILKGAQSPHTQHVYSALHLHNHFLSSFMLSKKKNPKNLFRIAHSHHLFQVRRVISYWKPFVASNSVIYFSGHCWGTYKWGTPEGKVILNTSSCLTLATFVEQKPSILPASWINCLVTMIYCNKTAKATFVIRLKKKKKGHFLLFKSTMTKV